jgi:large subunit ribosomal protein L24
MKKIKIGDKVKVILGKDKGKISKITSVFYKKSKVIVEGVNTKLKHVKPTKKDEVGKIIQFDAPLDLSNVMLCDKNGVASRVSISLQGGEKKSIFTKTKKLIS